MADNDGVSAVDELTTRKSKYIIIAIKTCKVC